MRSALQIVIYTLLFSNPLICFHSKGQSLTYSNKAYGIEVNFPAGWDLLTHQETDLLALASMPSIDEFTLINTPDTNGLSIILVARNNRSDAIYSIQILCDKFINESKDKSAFDYLIYGIEYMRQAGLEIPQFTIPVSYPTKNGINFYTCQLEVIKNGETHYERNFIVKRSKDFIIISGSFRSKNDDGWMQEVVNSISLNE